MMESRSLLDKAIERILEMSADLQIKRLATTKYSLAFHDYSVAIATYGNVLQVLTRLQQQEEYSPDLALFGVLESSRGSQAVL
jgi:hypothetical protein